MISFDNASLLTYSHVPKFFGDEIFNYAVEKNIKIEGYLLDLENFDGVSGVISGINLIKNLAKTSGEFILNGNYLGTGYIKNIEVGGEPNNDPNWVRYANYVADILILSTGSIHDMTGKYYQDIDQQVFNTKNLYLVNDFKESFSLNLGDNGIYNYSHVFDIGFENGIAKNIAITIAKTIASGLISSEVPFEILNGNNQDFLSGRKIYKETYDIINNRFSFSEEFQKSKSGDFADALYDYQITYDENGFVNVTEDVTINSLSSPIFEKSVDKLLNIKSGSYSRCQSMYYNYYANSGILNINSLNQGLNINKFNGEIICQTTFSNDNFIESGYDWESTVDVSDGQGERVVSVSLSIDGHGPKNSTTKWNNALMGFNNKKNIFDSLLVRNSGYNALKSLSINYKCRPSAMPYYLVNQQAESSFYNGKINFTKNYSDINGQSIESISRQSSVPLYTVYTSANVKVNHPQTSLGKYAKTVQTFNPNLTLAIPSPSVIAGIGLLESASTKHKINENIVETNAVYFTHNE